MTAAAITCELTRAQARRHVDAVRADLLAALPSTDGECALATGLLAARLTCQPDAFMCLGETGDGDHWWVRVGDLRLDPTADQFAEWLWPLPLVCKDRHKRSSYALTRQVPITRQTVIEHLRPLASFDPALRTWKAVQDRCPHHTHGWAAEHLAAAQLAQDALNRLPPVRPAPTGVTPCRLAPPSGGRGEQLAPQRVI